MPSLESSLIILGIETSCDETGVAIYSHQDGLLSHKLYSQIAIHANYGGVVPELASRDHIKRILPLIKGAMSDAKIKSEDITAIAYTAEPGLIGALMTGCSVAASLALAWQIPAIPINHLEGHLLAPMLEDNAPEFPFLALLASGGHTMLVEVFGLGDYKILGETLDDAAGEAFDKTAKLLDLGYPGGPKLAELAKSGNSGKFKFPRPMTDRPGLDFSFSGLKTFALNTINNTINSHDSSIGTKNKHQVNNRGSGGKECDNFQQVTDQTSFPPVEDNLVSTESSSTKELNSVLTTKADIARAFEDAVVATMVIKCRRALQKTKNKRLVIAGGVSANKALRDGLSEMAKSESVELYYPRLEFCTDNGAMIAYAGYLNYQAGNFTTNLEFLSTARRSI